MKGQRPEQGVPVSIHRAHGFRLYLIHHKLGGGMEEETPRSSSSVPASSCYLPTLSLECAPAITELQDEPDHLDRKSVV